MGCLMMRRLWRWITIPFIRHYRHTCMDCLVCGRYVGFSGHTTRQYRYCSLECAAYDGALKEPRKSWVLFGTIKEPKRHHEHDMKCGD